MKGRKPLPKHLKVIAGTYRKDRDRGEPEPIDGPPVKPERLSPEAAAHWDEMSPLLDGLGLLTRDVGPAFENLCESYALLAMARKEVAEHGAIDAKGRRSGAARQLEVAERSYQKWLVEFGLSPAARGRVSVIPQVKRGPSRFDKFDRFMTPEAAGEELERIISGDDGAA